MNATIRATAVLQVLLAVGLARLGAADAKFGGALDARQVSARAKADSACTTRRFTVECLAKVRGKGGFNILVAHEPKSSKAHWEIYTYARTGEFSAYLPANRPAEIKSGVDVTDGKWHHLAMVIDSGRIRLYVDGRKTADVKDTRPAGRNDPRGRLAFGSLVSGRIGCDGAIDEVRISKVPRKITAAPGRRFAVDADTVGLWRFDKPDKTGRFADASVGANAATIIPRGVRRRQPGHNESLVIAPAANTPLLRKMLKGALAELSLPSLVGAEDSRPALLDDWHEQHHHLSNRISGRETLPRGAAGQVLDTHALVRVSDGDALGVVLRRGKALLAHLTGKARAVDLAPLGRDLARLVAAAKKIPLTRVEKRKAYTLAAMALRRKITLANPLVNFDEVLFVARGVPNGSRLGGLRGTNDRQGQHFATQYFGFNSLPGGGLYALSNWKTAPKVRGIVKGALVTGGRLKGRPLDGGAYLSPDLSYDGRTILFSWTPAKNLNCYRWTKDTTWNIFRINVDGTDLRQLTDSPHDDFDACWLPGGRIIFMSQRRGGYIRCFASLPVPQHVMHSMKADGSDIYPISWFETDEWHPSVDNNGMIVYTRWDYTDRENCLGSNFWICYPDGRDPRAPHGNYPQPWHTFADNRHRDERIGRPYTEMNVRAIPGSHRYIATAAPHHGESFGSLVMLDLRQSDDGFMSQIKRVTPYPRFPESEMAGRRQYPYGTAWPLSEDFYLCNWWENVYLLDRFGNRALVCENRLVFDGKTNYDMRLIDPIPLRPRKAPPVIPTGTNQGAGAKAGGPTATISVMNVYDSDLPFPKGTKIKYLRVVQICLKTNAPMGRPNAGYQVENMPRIPLGIVPVEDDGSVYFEAPVERQLMFQVLDENYQAVQSMRSVAFVHPGERLSCIGCHEDRLKNTRRGVNPTALKRPASVLKPEAGPVEPITYYRMVKPIFEGTCQPCHRKKRKGPQDMSYKTLQPHVFYFAGGMRGSTVKPIHGGSRTIPGRFGARACKMGRAMITADHRKRVSEGDRHRVTLWLDCNSMRLGALHSEAKQVEGKQVVWPVLDVDPRNPQGLERIARKLNP